MSTARGCECGPGERFIDKIVYETTFTAFSLPRVARRVRGADVLVCVVPALTAAASAAALRRVAGRSTRLVMWIQDLVLQAGLSVGAAGRGSQAALRFGGLLERAAFRAADRIIVCNPEFTAHVVACGANPEAVTALPNWVDTEAIVPVTPNGNRTSTRFLHTGNIGYTQGLETLLDAARIVGKPVAVHIVGEGNRAGQIRELAADIDNVTVSRAGAG